MHSIKFLPLPPLYKQALFPKYSPHRFSLVFHFSYKILISSFGFALIVFFFFLCSFQELANTQEPILEGDNKNRDVVLAFYDALKARDVDKVHQILAPDLEWWFHGPPTHQFMMRLLTGASSDDSFKFDPRSFNTFGSTVIAEGCDSSQSISWVHAWTVTDGIITQVREYFNTSLTVTLLGNPNHSPPSAYNKPSSSTAEITPAHCPSIWESSFSNQVGKSVPGLVLAI